MRTIFAFYGITDFTTISAENLDVIGQDVEAIIGNAIKNAQDLAKSF